MLEGWERAREVRRELKTEWARLWQTKYDDQVRAEDVSQREFERLFVDKGEIIYATRDYKPLSFRDILERHIGSETADKVFPDAAVGGWRKFVKEHLQSPRPAGGRERPEVGVDLRQQQRKGGHGWLNRARTWKKIRKNEIVD
jgi:hypothetical protein